LVAKDLQTTTSQRQLWQKTWAAWFNRVVLVNMPLNTQAVAPVILDRSDVTRPSDALLDSDRLRCQLALHFRDAKQYWGVEECMTVNQRSGDTRAHLSLLMVNVSQAWMRPMRTHWPEGSVHDLKAWLRSRKSVVETFTWLPEMPEPICIDQVMAQIADLGRVNHAVNAA
jgi:putative transposase